MECGVSVPGEVRECCVSVLESGGGSAIECARRDMRECGVRVHGGARECGRVCTKRWCARRGARECGVSMQVSVQGEMWVSVVCAGTESGEGVSVQGQWRVSVVCVCSRGAREHRVSMHGEVRGCVV